MNIRVMLKNFEYDSPFAYWGEFGDGISCLRDTTKPPLNTRLFAYPLELTISNLCALLSNPFHYIRDGNVRSCSLFPRYLI